MIGPGLQGLPILLDLGLEKHRGSGVCFVSPVETSAIGQTLDGEIHTAGEMVFIPIDKLQDERAGGF